MRSLSSGAQQKIQSRTGTEPVVIIEIEWASGGKRLYADKDFQSAKGKIIDISGFEGTKRLKGGQSTTMTMTIDDSDGDIRDLLKINDPQKAKAIVYQSFEGLSGGSNFVLFSGQVNSPIIWDEGTRTYRISVISDVEGREVGFSPESGFFEFVDPTIIGKPWPICFGSPIRVPAQRITPRIEATSLTKYHPITQEALDALEQKLQKYTVMLAEIGLADSAQDITDISIIIPNADYLKYLADISAAYSEFTTIVEDLIIANPNQEDNLNTFVINVIDISFKNFQVEKINSFVLNTNEKLTIANQENQDLIDAKLTEEDKIPFHDQIIINGIITALENTAATIAGLQATITALNDHITSVLNPEIVTAETSRDTVSALMTVFDLTTIYFESNEVFPQGEAELIVNKQRLAGVITNNVFITPGVPTALDVEAVNIDARLNSNPNEFWIENWTDGETPNLRNRYCLIDSIDTSGFTRKRVIFINQQEGNRCYFAPLVYESGEVVEGRQTYSFKLFKAGDTIVAMATSYLKATWGPLLEPAGDIPPDFVSGLYQLEVSDWELEIGDKISYGVDSNEVYIANLYESTVVHEVVAYKQEGGKRVLKPLPTHYYTVDLTYEIEGFTTTAITLQRSLTDYEGENWEDQIYVTLTSTLSNNTSEVIKWIFENWTDIEIDSPSFSSVFNSLEDFPSDFALLTKQNAITLVEDIAWQARCATWVTSDNDGDSIAYIKYLSAEPSQDFNINESYIEANTLQVTLTDTEEIVTILEGEWRRDYAEIEPNIIILRNNVPLYGAHKEKHQFFIYNVEEYIQRSMLFWLIRKSNTWKRIVFNGFLNLLELEIFDTLLIALNSQHFSNSPVKTVIEGIEYNSNDHSLRFTCWLPIRAGFMVPYIFAWMSSAPSGFEYPTDDDPFAGGG